MAGQNTSHAVMAQRVEPHDSLDDFPTPPWGTRALMRFLDAQGQILLGQTCWEPTANRGAMVRVLAESFRHVYGTDIHDYGSGFGVRDFLFPGDEPPFDWIITNPPYRLATEFALTALSRVQVGVAMLLRSTWTEGGGRYRSLFARQAPTFQLVFSERVPMFRGRLDGKGSTATAYSWFVWDVRHKPYRNQAMTAVWIPPGTRRRLERPGDYDDDAPRGAA